MKILYKSWWYTGILFIGYVGAFKLWDLYQDRTGSLLVGLGIAIPLLLILIPATKHNYFLNKRDLRHHVIVIIDLMLEGALYNIADGLKIIGVFPSDKEFVFHNDDEYGYCVMVFMLILIGYRLHAKKSIEKNEQKQI